MSIASLRAVMWGIRQPNRDRCLGILDRHGDLFAKAWGSAHNHQAYAGGYIDHVTGVLKLAFVLHATMKTLAPLPFSFDDAALVLFLHDIEKPFKNVAYTEWSKVGRRKYRETLINIEGIELTSDQQNALRYVEGEGDDYSSECRIMNELAAFCHMCDVASARIWHDEDSSVLVAEAR